MSWMVNSIGYWPLCLAGPPVNEPAGAVVSTQADVLERLLGQTLAVCRDDHQFDLAIICSTHLSPRLVHGRRGAASVWETLKTAYGVRTCTWVSAYQCCSWVQALRALHKPEVQKVLLTIVDVEIDGLGRIDKEFVYGRGRQGVLHAGLQRSEVIDSGALLTLIPPSAHAVLSFARYVDLALADRPVLFLGPFFPAATQRTFERALDNYAIAPTRHESYRHCFGADPWIGLAHSVRGGTIGGDREVVLGSLALAGYAGLCRLEVSRTCRVVNFSARNDLFEGLHL